MSLLPDLDSLDEKLDRTIKLMAEILEEMKKANAWLEAIWRNE